MALSHTLLSHHRVHDQYQHGDENRRTDQRRDNHMHADSAALHPLRRSRRLRTPKNDQNTAFIVCAETALARAAAVIAYLLVSFHGSCLRLRRRVAGAALPPSPLPA